MYYMHAITTTRELVEGLFRSWHTSTTWYHEDNILIKDLFLNILKSIKYHLQAIEGQNNLEEENISNPRLLRLLDQVLGNIRFSQEEIYVKENYYRNKKKLNLSLSATEEHCLFLLEIFYGQLTSLGGDITTLMNSLTQEEMSEPVLKGENDD